MFVNLVNDAKHDIAHLAVRARLPGQTHEERADLPEATTATFQMVFPLTTYLNQHTLEYQVDWTTAAGTTDSTGWLKWDIKDDGMVISVEPGLVA